MFRLFTSDAVLVTLMACPRSIYSWDINITKSGKNIFMDKRNGSDIDVLSVNENATDPPCEPEKDTVNINCVSMLASECTLVDHSFTDMSVKGSEGGVAFENDVEANKKNVVFRYREWVLCMCFLIFVSNPG